MLDEVHDGIPPRSAGQTVLYALGKISSHNVAIAGYPVGEVGIGVSGGIVSEALRDFPNLEAGILVGIAAGIPSPNRDICLGDVAVAVPTKDNPGVIGYDLVKVDDDEVVQLKQWQNSTHALLRSAIASIQVQEVRPHSSFTRHLEVLERLPEFKRPGPVLPNSEPLALNVRDHPIAHYGTILSGNGVIKSKKRRDELRDKYNGIAIEKEAAGMTTRLPVAVVRGISDFADSNKSDEWHHYAALTAAAYAKEMLIKLGPRKGTGFASQSLISSHIDNSLRLSLPEKCSFMGREDELAKLEEWVGFCPKKTPQKSTVTLWGLAGVGKSQLVSEFVKKQREKHPTSDIFWASGATKEAFEQSILGILKPANNSRIGIPEGSEGYDEHRSMLINSFFSELKSTMRSRWLLIIDGISGDSSLQQLIRDHLDKLPWGSIVLTTRSTEVANWYHDILDLAKILSYHPLSLRLAASVISYYQLSVRQYVKKWRARQLSHEHRTNMSLLQSLELSFEELEKTNMMAAKLLMLFGYLDPRDLWVDLCFNATDDDLPEWLRRIGSSENFHEYYASMRNLSFIEAKPSGSRRDQVCYEIHPAVHEFARWKAKENEKEYVKAAVYLVAAKVPRSTDKNFLEVVQRLEPHAEQCMIYMKQGRGGSSLDLMELECFGNLFRHLGRHDEASWLYERILHIMNGEEEPDESTLEVMAGIENNLGLTYHARRQYDLALRSYSRSYLKRIHLVPKEDDALMMTEYNKGRAFLMLGKLDEALQTLLKVAAHFSRLAAPNEFSGHDPTSGDEAMGEIYFRILNDLGEIYLRKKDLEKAEHNFSTAFYGHKKYLHEMHPATFAARLNMGRLCVEKSRFATAKRIFGYIIETYTEWWGRQHSETMRALAELAGLHMRRAELKRLMGDGGEWDIAMATDLWTEILSFHQEVFGHNSDAATLTRLKLQQVIALSQSNINETLELHFMRNEKLTEFKVMFPTYGLKGTLPSPAVHLIDKKNAGQAIFYLNFESGTQLLIDFGTPEILSIAWDHCNTPGVPEAQKVACRAEIHMFLAAHLESVLLQENDHNILGYTVKIDALSDGKAAEQSLKDVSEKAPHFPPTSVRLETISYRPDGKEVQVGAEKSDNNAFLFTEMAQFREIPNKDL
ncbi:tetratricopeptide repeat domain-containing protein [Fusarium circinatum]|uniref:Tetratricopeptide repeat domain-containing protein n=1 Tax=Fusarium circinatum TaxID=48490 RepID=A0A8H5X9Y3_FUSCI|nr:tetratricopeptide repeat domain-containing protein [Fusarium circinatum]